MANGKILIRLSVLIWLSAITNHASKSPKYSSEVYHLFSSARHWKRSLTERTQAANGAQWSDWAPWSPCSRSCGGGVAVQSRECVARPADARSRRGRRKRRPYNDVVPDHTYKPTKCVGLYKRYHMCNTQPCPGPASDFRAMQCAQFNNKLFKGERHFWIPYRSGENDCALNCRAVGQPFYATLNQTVIDGTPCRGPELPASLGRAHRYRNRLLQGVCAEGVCKIVGCDGIVGSDRLPDLCGGCSRNGRPGPNQGQCRLISGLFTNTMLPLGYSLVATIPRGACSVNITDMDNTKDFLALRGADGTYIISTKYPAIREGDFAAAGTVFSYLMKDDGIRESITAPGPLTEPVDLMVFHRDTMNGIKYQYLINVDGISSPSLQLRTTTPRKELPVASTTEAVIAGHQHSRPPATHHHHSRHHLPGNVINATVIDNFHRAHPSKSVFPYGHGVLATESAGAPAHRLDPSRAYSPIHSHGNSTTTGQVPVMAPPYKARPKRRKYFWKLTGYTPCTRTCGGGTQSAQYSCFREMGNSMVHERRCSVSEKPRDNADRRCNTGPCPARWRVGEWGPCSATCGRASQSRDLYCEQETQLRSIRVNSGACMEIQPLTTRPCDLPECAKTHFPTMSSRLDELDSSNAIDSSFAPIHDNETFSAGYPQIRKPPIQDHTVHPSHHRVHHPHTVMYHRPSSTTLRSYSLEAISNKASWLYTEWTHKCSDECGTGVQTRSVVCDPGDSSSTRLLSIEDHNSSQCSSIQPAPDRERACSSDKRCGGKWFAGPWGKCGGECGSGKQRRDVVCAAKVRGQVVITHEAACSLEERPDAERSCSNNAADVCQPKWFRADWSECTKTCGTGQQRRHVKCLDYNNVPSTGCKEDDRPVTHRTCNTQICYPEYRSSTIDNSTNLHGYSVMNNDNVYHRVQHDSAKPTSHISGGCTDSESNCALVVQARLCKYKFYLESCCLSCRRSPGEA